MIPDVPWIAFVQARSVQSHCFINKRNPQQWPEMQFCFVILKLLLIYEHNQTADVGASASILQFLALL